eukprot:CCRYP_012364-RA/>CCRYP_012364-RA protein AED:0.03 eAED:0.03 QI:636/0.33/0.5/1/0/0/4/0/300
MAIMLTLLKVLHMFQKIVQKSNESKYTRTNSAHSKAAYSRHSHTHSNSEKYSNQVGIKQSHSKYDQLRSTHRNRAHSNNIKSVTSLVTPEKILSFFQNRGWQADIVTEFSMSYDMIKVDRRGILKCMDGRESDNFKFGGPKLPGGIYAIAQNREVITLKGLREIAEEVIHMGYIPSVHGDHSDDMLGCGFFRLWMMGKLGKLGSPRPQFNADQGAKAVKAAGGIIEMQYGSHSEKTLYINLLKRDQRFVVDAWVATKFRLNVTKLLADTIAAVEILGGPKKAIIIIPSMTLDDYVWPSYF